ncbi:MAG: hypothetical protein P1U86_11990 [Verrucomicrobiales bacterium]|nr:hypothetical protein [Verrucomicrobiales bacterium]
MRIPLTLQFREKPAEAQPSAGWLPSDDAKVWLSELASGAAQGKPLLALPVSESASSPACKGAFLLPQSTNPPSFSPRVIPLYEALPGIHIPLDSKFSAEILAHEKKHFFPHEVHFFHPVLGSVGFSKSDAIAPVSLIVVPPAREINWSVGVEGPPSSPPLTGFSIPSPPSPDAALEEAAGDISSKKGKLSKEKSGLGNALGILGGGIAGGLALGLHGLASAFSSGEGPSANANADSISQQKSDAFLKWAQQNWENLFNARKREINKLLDKLDKNPDEGLKYALPLTGSGSSRGSAPPSTRLGLRNMRFSPGGGSGPADSWDLDYNQRLALEKRYRDVAEREIAKGNYDRAAYILGNLVGDWNGVAAALVKGERYRDAVSIYLHKLKNKTAAANCYEGAGMLQQAADLQKEMRNFEKAGDLYERLGNESEANRLWILAADGQTDPIQKARIWDEKIKSPSVALEILDQAWPKGNRSQELLRRMFEILQQHDSVAHAEVLIVRVLEHEDDIHGLPLTTQLELFHSVTQRWENDSLKELVSTEMWSRIAHEVSAESKDTEKLLNLIPRLAPGDRLLERDVKRFSLPKHQFKSPKTDRYTGQMLVKEINEIPGEAEWLSLCAIGVEVSFVGVRSGHVYVGQETKGVCDTHPLSVEHQAGNEIQLSHRRGKKVPESPWFLHYPSQKKLAFIGGHQGDSGFQNSVLAIGNWRESEDIIALEYTDAGSLVAHRYTSTLQRSSSIPLDVAAPSVLGAEWCIDAYGYAICLASDGFFARRENDGTFSTIAIGGVPTSLQISPVDDSQVIVVVNREVLLISRDTPQKPLETVNLLSLGSEEPEPVTTFLADGSIVIVHSGGGEIFAPDSFLTPKAKFSFPTDAGTPVGVVCRSGGELTILTKAGKLIHL